MDFKALKQKVIKFKDDTVSSAAKKLAESGLVINTKEDLDKIIAKSKNVNYTNKETGVSKVFKKHSIVIFVKKESEFYKDALVQMPVLVTKAYAGSINLKMCDLDLKDLSDYKITETPALVLFTDEKLTKLIVGEKNIKTIVKTLDLDIIKAIENIV